MANLYYKYDGSNMPYAAASVKQEKNIFSPIFSNPTLRKEQISGLTSAVARRQYATLA
jgi:hypothetical protein